MKNQIRIELHCHLDGSLPLPLLRAAFPDRPEEEFRAPEHCGSLAAYLSRFGLPVRYLQSPGALERAAAALGEALAADRVAYAEIRYAPALLASPPAAQRDGLEAVLRGFQAAEPQIGVLLCAMRQLPEQENLQTLRLARDYLGAGVCGVDLAGDEKLHPNGEFAGLFAAARRLGLPFTIHAGECGSAASVRDALDFGARRIGHGIAMAGDAALQRRCAREGIGVELCPVSNFQTGAVKRRADYPLREFLQNGVPVTVNTDNRTVSGTTLAREFGLLETEFGLGAAEERRLTENAIRCAFADDATKDRLLRRLEKE